MTAWTWDSATVTFAAGLMAVYLLGVQAVRRRGLGWPTRRTVAWCGGCACLVLFTVGPTGAYARLLLSVYAVQVLVLALGVPVLLVYGRPFALGTDTASDVVSLRLLRAGAGRAAAFFASPLIGPILVPVLLAVLFFTPLLTLSLTHTWVYEGEQITLVLIGLLVAVGIVGSGPERLTSFAFATAVAVGLGELLLDAVPGIVMRLRTHLLAQPPWVGLHRGWGPSPLHDQQFAAAVVWFVAEAADLPFLFLLVRRWIRADEREAVRIDRELDDQQRRATAVAETAEHSSPNPAPTEDADNFFARPWWETDPDRLRGHRVGDYYHKQE